MVTAAQSNPSTGSNAFKSFADMVDYSKMYAELQQHGIELTDEEKKRCEAICGDRLRNHDGGQIIGNSFGGALQGIVYTLFAFIKDIFGGNFGSLGDLASNFGSAVTSSSEKSKLFQLQLAESETYLNLQKAGGNLAKAAEYITGMKPQSDNSPAEVLNASVLNQVGASINLPVDTDTRLNLKHENVAEAHGPGNLPPRAMTEGLTARGKSA